MPGTVDMTVIHGLGQPLGPIEELTAVVYAEWLCCQIAF